MTMIESPKTKDHYFSQMIVAVQQTQVARNNLHDGMLIRVVSLFENQYQISDRNLKTMHHDSMIGTPVFPHFFCSYLASVFIRFSFCMFSTCLDIQRSRTYRQKSLKKSQSQHIVFKPFTNFLKQVMNFWKLNHPSCWSAFFICQSKVVLLIISQPPFSPSCVAFLCPKWQFWKKCRTSVCSPVPTHSSRISTRRKLLLLLSSHIAVEQPNPRKKKKILSYPSANIKLTYFT